MGTIHAYVKLPQYKVCSHTIQRNNVGMYTPKSVEFVSTIIYTGYISTKRAANAFYGMQLKFLWSVFLSVYCVCPQYKSNESV